MKRTAPNEIRRKLKKRRKRIEKAAQEKAAALQGTATTAAGTAISSLSEEPIDADVADVDAYRKWQEILKDPLLNDGRIVTATTGEAIDLGMFPSKFKERIAHLNFQEQGVLTKKATEYRSLLGSANIYKRQAYKGHTANVFRLTAKTSHQLKVLESERGREVLELYGRMFTPREVHEVVVRDFGMMISLEAVVKFREEHLEDITARIENFQRDFKDIRLAVKRGRLEELVYLYERTKNKHTVTENNQDRDFMLKLLEQVRKETEGDILKIEGTFEHKVEASINLHLREEVLDTINISQIVLGRIASRMNISGERLIAQLNDSHYSKFNAMVDGVVVDAEYEDLTYPSSHNYDFDAIKTSYEVITKEDASYKEKIAQEQKKAIENASVKVDGRTIKERLLDKLEKDKAKVSMKGAEADHRMLELNAARDSTIAKEERLIREQRKVGKKKTMIRRTKERMEFKKKFAKGGRPPKDDGII